LQPKIANEADAIEGDRMTAPFFPAPAQFLWLPLPGSNADLAAMVFFLGIVGIIVWQIYYSTEK
jgi:hypothetical protein